MASSLDRSSPIPLYLQLANRLEEQIHRGEIGVGSRLAPETALAQEAGLNRNTVRQAIALLVRKGLIEKHKGVGSFVCRGEALQPIHELGRMTSFIDDFDVAGIETQDIVLAQRRERAGPALAAQLGLAPGDPVVMLERLRIANQTPFVLEQEYFPYDQFSGLLQIDIRGPLYRLLVERFGADLHHSVQTLRAVRPPRAVAEKLGISPSVPCIFLESLAYTSAGRCIEVLRSTYRGDRYLFRVEAGQYRREMAFGGAS
jgi:GntR family transcriptional regulator